MANPRNVQVSRHVQDLYNSATTVQARYAFYSAFFEEVAPNGLAVVPIADVGSGVRKELRLLTWHTHKILFSGLVHRPSDREVEGITADEAYTRASNDEQWDFFRFFTADDTISFFKGVVDESDVHDGDWQLEAIFHPINEAQEIHDYLEGKLMMLRPTER